MLSGTPDDADSGDESESDSNMMPLISKEETDAMDSGDESDDEPMSKEMLEDICDGSKSHTSVNRREERSKIRDRIKRSQVEWKGELSSMRNMGKVFHKVFNAVVNDISQVLPILGEYCSEVSYSIPEPRNFAEVTRLS